MSGAADQTRNFSVAGSGAYLPERIVSASDLDKLTRARSGSTIEKFGVRKRYWAKPHETSSFMAAVAAEEALAQAGWAPDTLDLVLGACGVMEQPIPGTAVLVQRRLGLGSSGIPSFDINATCLSFLVALDRVLAGFALGEWRRALIVSADIASAAIDLRNPEASVLFSDGAVAFALEAGGPHCSLAHRFSTYSDAADACRLEAGGTRIRPEPDIAAFLAHAKFQMDGRAVFRATSQRFPDFLRLLLGAARIDAADLDLIVPHQASAAALQYLKRTIPNGTDKTIDIFADIGNQVATSLPFALHVARQRGLLRPGDRALLIGSAAGISLGGTVIRW